MNDSIIDYSKAEQHEQYKILSPIIRQWGKLKYPSSSVVEAIKLVESLLLERPYEWLYWAILNDLYPISRGETYCLAKAVKAAEKCCEIRPGDLRSEYMLACTLRLLLQAKYYVSYTKADPLDYQTQAVKKNSAMEKVNTEGTFVFSPTKAALSLRKLDMTLDQAAEKTIHLFQSLLSRITKKNEINLIKESLAVMQSDFPNIR